MTPHLVLTEVPSLCSDARATGLDHPVGKRQTSPQETPIVGPGAPRECPGRKPKASEGRPTSDQPPDCTFRHSTGKMDMPTAQQQNNDVVNNLRSHLRLVTPTPAPANPKGVVEIIDDGGPLVVVDATVPTAIAFEIAKLCATASIPVNWSPAGGTP